MRGALASAPGPSADGSTGTSRQPSGSSPSSRQPCSTASRAPSSRMKTIANPHPGSGSSADGQRQQDAGAVAGLAIGRRGAAVADAAEPREQEVDDLAGGAPGRVRDEADAAGTAVGGEIVE